MLVRLLERFKFSWQRQSSPDLSWLTSDLAISRAPLAREWPAIKAAGIRSVLDLRLAECAEGVSESVGLAYLNLPVTDGGAPTADEMRYATEWVAGQIAGVGPVLIHCREGLGRSPLVACAALIRLGFPLSEAFLVVRRARPHMVFSDRQIAALQAFAADNPSKQPERNLSRCWAY